MEKRVVTKDYLDLKLENQKKSMIIWLGSVVFCSVISVVAGFTVWQEKSLKARFQAIDSRFQAIDSRFFKMEQDIRDIKNFIFSLSKNEKK